MKTMCYGNDPAQVLDLYLPEEKEFDLFVYFHGGGLVQGDKADGALLAEFLNPRGVAVVSANYRMYPTAKYPEFVEDAAATVAWVRKNIGAYGTCKRVFVGGSSAGGYLSMMLCFDPRYLKNQGVESGQIDGYFHDAGQPTAHFMVLRMEGTDLRRTIVDERAPMYFVGLEESYPPMRFIVSDDDMPGRLEQTMLMMATLKRFDHEAPKVSLEQRHGKHCAYVRERDEQGQSILGDMIFRFITDVTQMETKGE